ncbi:purine-nucleoside phosphorylase [Proteinivorax tanatarense]|uniref:Purine nucleoside phosphorylase n=1 Tax=Proteinivorax tanatarense TaxID=1260629 RepID=A0AAU7VP53_9FIRM
MNLLERISEAGRFIKSKTNYTPEVGLILGSGLGKLADEIQNSVKIKYTDIPYFPQSTVEGHAGQLIIGKLEGKVVVALQGRFHYYEGYTMQEVTFPVYVMKELGIQVLVATNACGGLSEKFSAGDLMVIEDHINTYWTNPLIGSNFEQLGPRFPDMSEAYNKDFIKLLEKVADSQGVNIQKGVYAPITGPSYSTKAELKMLITLGADTVGMSTVPEVIVANYLGLKVLGISCITDMAIPDNLHPPTHEQVVKIATETRPKFIDLVKGWLKEVKI